MDPLGCDMESQDRVIRPAPGAGRARALGPRVMSCRPSWMTRPKSASMSVGSLMVALLPKRWASERQGAPAGRLSAPRPESRGGAASPRPRRAGRCIHHAPEGGPPAGEHAQGAPPLECRGRHRRGERASPCAAQRMPCHGAKDRGGKIDSPERVARLTHLRELQRARGRKTKP